MGSFLIRSAAAGMALCLSALCAAEGHAQQSRSQRSEAQKPQGRDKISDMLLKRDEDRRPTGPASARYVVEGSVSFILDRSAPLPLIRFEGSNEVWVLYPQPVSSNDIIYKNELGEPVLRASGLGGMTVFTAKRPQGAEASLAGRGPSLQLPVFNALLAVKEAGFAMQAASGRAERAVGQPVEFYADDVRSEQGLAMVVDAANVTAEAVQRLARSDKVPPALRRLGTVVFLEGDKASVKFDRGQLTIVVVPGRGFAGRPSSEKIMRVIH